MSFLRPEAMAALYRWREVIAAAGVVMAGLWFVGQRGFLMGALGMALIGAGLGLGWVALRRLRFARPVDAPGIVEVLEGQVSYMGPEAGGWVALSELERVVLTGPAGARVWRLIQADGQGVDLPTRAAGADRLFDVFAGLPGFDMAGALAALDSPQPVDRVLWSRTRPTALPRR
jgi:hypothetical protein